MEVLLKELQNKAIKTNKQTTDLHTSIVHNHSFKLDLGVEFRDFLAGI